MNEWTQGAYTSDLQKTAAVVPEMMDVLSVWEPEMTLDDLERCVIQQGALGRVSTTRLQDIIRRSFNQRFLNPDDRGARNAKRILQRGLGATAFREVLFLYCIRTYPVIYDFLVERYWPAALTGHETITGNQIVMHLTDKFGTERNPEGWSQSAARWLSCRDHVAYGLLPLYVHEVARGDSPAGVGTGGDGRPGLPGSGRNGGDDCVRATGWLIFYVFTYKVKHDIYTMNVYYETTKLHKLSDTYKEARRQMGHPSAKKLMMRLQELIVVPTLADIPSTPPPRLHQLQGGSEVEFAVMLHGGDRLVFRVRDSPVPRLPDGGIDRGLVRSVVITFVGDYHG